MNKVQVQVTTVVNTTIVGIEGDAFYVRIKQHDGKFYLETYKVESTFVKILDNAVHDDAQDALGNAVKRVVEFHNG